MRAETVTLEPSTNFEEAIGSLHIRRRDGWDVPTLVVLVHGWGGDIRGTWGRLPELLLGHFPPAFDIGLFEYLSGLGTIGKKGAADVADQLIEDISLAAEKRGYRQVAIVGYSLGGLVAAIATERLLRERESPVVTGLLCVGTPWRGVRLARFASLFDRQLRDVGPAGRSLRAEAISAYSYTAQFAWAADVHGRGDPLDSTHPSEGTTRYWTYFSHRGACAASETDDPRLRPFLRLADVSSRPSTLMYIRNLRDDLANWSIRPISVRSADQLYERRSASEWREVASEDDLSERMPDFTARVSDPSTEAGRWKVEDILALLDSPQDLICFTGEGGAGKTTAITEIARVATENALKAPRHSLVPVVIRLKDEPLELPNERTTSAMLMALSGLCEPRTAFESWCGTQSSEDPFPDLLLLADGLDEANPRQTDVLHELSKQVARAGGKAIVAGRPEAMIRDRSFRLLRLDALDAGLIERIARRQLGEKEAQEFLRWVGPGLHELLINPGQLEMTMRLWEGGGHLQAPPKTIGELYDRALPQCLARSREARDIPTARLPSESYRTSERVKRQLQGIAFSQLSAATPDAHSTWISPTDAGLSEEDCEALENAAILEQRQVSQGKTAWRFASHRWREFFASLEMRRRAELAETLDDIAKPSCLNVWRMAASPSTGALLEAAASTSPILEVVVQVSSGTAATKETLASIPAGQRRLLPRILRDMPGPATTRTLVNLCKGQDEDVLVRGRAALALRETTDNTALEALVSLCRAHERVISSSAEAALGAIDRSYTNSLLALCADPDPRVRQTAAGALRRARKGAPFRSLVAMCRDPNASVRRAAATSLEGADDPSAVAALRLLCRDQAKMVRRAAAQALWGTEDPKALCALLALCRDPDYRVRRNAAAAIRGAPNTALLGGVVLLCHDADDELRVTGTKALWGTSDPNAVRVLVDLTFDPETAVRQAAASGLRGTKDSAALQALVRLCRDEDPGVRGEAVQALRGTHDQATLAALVGLCRDSDGRIPATAARALVGTIHPSAVQTLVALLADRRTQVRVAAAGALRETADLKALQALLGLRKDPIAKVRTAAARALRGREDQASRDTILAFCQDENAAVRSTGARALRGTTRRSEVEALVNLCVDPVEHVRGAAARALHATSDQSAVERLVSLLEDPKAAVRRSALSALLEAPPRSAIAQTLLQTAHRSLVFSRLVRDDVPLQDWPQ